MQHETLPVLTDSGEYLHVRVGQAGATRLRAYWAAAYRSLARGDVADLEPFETVTLQDTAGHGYRLMCDLDALYQFEAQLTDAERREMAGVLADRGGEDGEV